VHHNGELNFPILVAPVNDSRALSEAKQRVSLGKVAKHCRRIPPQRIVRTFRKLHRMPANRVFGEIAMEMPESACRDLPPFCSGDPAEASEPRDCSRRSGDVTRHHPHCEK
jgi:hypothetical protein